MTVPCPVVGVVVLSTLVRKGPGKYTPVEIDICGKHLHELLGRRLNRQRYAILVGKLDELGISSGDVFLLQEEFYDKAGNALRPVTFAEVVDD